MLTSLLVIRWFWLVSSIAGILVRVITLREAWLDWDATLDGGFKTVETQFGGRSILRRLAFAGMCHEVVLLFTEVVLLTVVVALLLPAASGFTVALLLPAAPGFTVDVLFLARNLAFGMVAFVLTVDGLVNFLVRRKVRDALRKGSVPR